METINHFPTVTEMGKMDTHLEIIVIMILRGFASVFTKLY